MKPEELSEIVELLPRGRTVFCYYADAYAVGLLRRAIGGAMGIARIKRSRFAPLLERPIIADLCRRVGGGVLTPADLRTVGDPDPRSYLLTLGRWGGHPRWDQVSRRGENLVLQLNFSNRHNRPYHELIKPSAGRRGPFEMIGHPVSRQRNTLAWARLDVDLARGEALIEEIQNDWLRRAKWMRNLADRAQDKRAPLAERFKWMEHFGARAIDVLRYVDEVLGPHMLLWDEAMLWAAVWFLREELGIGRIFMHTWESGNALKHIRYYYPPRSVYSKLPRRFCFGKTDGWPDILAGRRREKRFRGRRATKLQFHLLEL